MLDCVSLLATTIFLLIFLGFLYIQQKSSLTPVSYEVSKEERLDQLSSSKESLPFASKLGKTYTFSWCSGGDRIAIKNKIYFSSEEEALRSGRVLSKLCQK